MATVEAIRFGETMRHVASGSQDVAEARLAAAEHRPPRWTGRWRSGCSHPDAEEPANQRDAEHRRPDRDRPEPARDGHRGL